MGRGGGPLRVAEVGLARHAHAPVAPRPARRPLDGVVAVVDLVPEGVPLALGAVLAAHVLDDAGVAAPRPVAADAGM